MISHNFKDTMMNVDFEVYVQPIIISTVDLSEPPAGPDLTEQ